MNTRVLMSASAIVMGVVGLAMSFAPDEILHYLGQADILTFEKLIVQLAGALYFAFAMTNWTARANLIGGIYGRPIAIGNVTHFMIGALALIKVCFHTIDPVILGITIVYTVFAISFAVAFFTHPVKE